MTCLILCTLFTTHEETNAVFLLVEFQTSIGAVLTPRGQSNKTNKKKKSTDLKEMADFCLQPFNWIDTFSDIRLQISTCKQFSYDETLVSRS